MESILDPILIGELGFVIVAIMQLIKSHPKMRGSDIPWLSGVVGALLSLLWFLVAGDLYHGAMDWMNLYRSIAIGVVAAVASIIGYNVQKALPTPNILPTSNELTEQKLEEDMTKTVTTDVEAVAVATVDVETEKTVDPKENIG